MVKLGKKNWGGGGLQGVHGGARSQALAPIHLPLKVPRGRVSVCPRHHGGDVSKVYLGTICYRFSNYADIQYRLKVEVD